jgi:hypothetical protein
MWTLRLISAIISHPQPATQGLRQSASARLPFGNATPPHPHKKSFPRNLILSDRTSFLYVNVLFFKYFRSCKNISKRRSDNVKVQCLQINSIYSNI